MAANCVYFAGVDFDASRGGVDCRGVGCDGVEHATFLREANKVRRLLRAALLGVMGAIVSSI